ncbi:22675_t:CDS:2, partial [Cetraspora pellucida]
LFDAKHAQASEYKNEFYADGGKLFCHVCKITIDHTCKLIIDNHRISKKHQSNLKLKNTTSQKSHQITITSCHKVLSEHKQINVDLINTLTAANIPLEKVEKLKTLFLNKYYPNLPPIENPIDLENLNIPNTIRSILPPLSIKTRWNTWF